VNKPPDHIIAEVSAWVEAYLAHTAAREWGTANGCFLYLAGMYSMAHHLKARYQLWLNTIMNAIVEMEGLAATINLQLLQQ